VISSSNINKSQSFSIHEFASQPRTTIIVIEIIGSYGTRPHSLREQDKFQVPEREKGFVENEALRNITSRPNIYIITDRLYDCKRMYKKQKLLAKFLGNLPPEREKR
jgi:hypothetical protein